MSVELSLSASAFANHCRARLLPSLGAAAAAPYHFTHSLARTKLSLCPANSPDIRLQPFLLEFYVLQK